MRVRDASVVVLRAVIILDAVVFLIAAALNLGARIPLDFAELSFPVAIWQAGVGEAAIGLVLLAAAATASPRLSWVASGMSAIGILFGLSSARVQGPAREVHVLLVPLAFVILALLVWRRQQDHQALDESSAHATE